MTYTNLILYYESALNILNKDELTKLILRDESPLTMQNELLTPQIAQQEDHSVFARQKVRGQGVFQFSQWNQSSQKL